MKSQTFSDLYHIEDNIYCNDDIVISRFHKLIVVYYKIQNVFSYFLLKRSRECNATNALMSLVNSENPEQPLRSLIGDNPPDNLLCNVEEYEVILTPRSLGNFDLVITYEPLDYLASVKNKACIVYLNETFHNVVEIFPLITSMSSPNEYVRTEFVSILKSTFEQLPTHTILLMGMQSLNKNLKFIPNDKHDLTIHLLHADSFFKPLYPGLNFVVIYLDEDKHLAEPILPYDNTSQPRFLVKKLQSLESFFDKKKTI